MNQLKKIKIKYKYSDKKEIIYHLTKLNFRLTFIFLKKTNICE